MTKPPGLRGFLRIANQHYDREALADILAAEIVTGARRRFEAGETPAAVVAALKRALPLEGEDEIAALRLILREWRLFRLERGAGYEVRDAPRGGTKR